MNATWIFCLYWLLHPALGDRALEKCRAVQALLLPSGIRNGTLPLTLKVM